MPMFNPTHVATQVSSAPTLLYVLPMVQVFMKDTAPHTVLTTEFLLPLLTQEEWALWYHLQQKLGDLTPLIAIIPPAYLVLFSKNASYPANILTGDILNDTDTKELSVVIKPIASTNPDSRYIALFNKPIVGVSPTELLATLGGGLLKAVGVDVYARINRGYIFKNAMTMA